MAGCFVLGIIQVVAAIGSQRLALVVDGLHNMSETATVGVNRSARRMEGRRLGTLWTCWLLPLAPALSAILAISAAVIMPFVLRGYHATQGVWLSLGLSSVSLAVNVLFAARLHAGHDHGDTNSFAATMHFVGDSMASLLAAAAYLVIGVTGGNTYCDLLAEIGGTVCIVGVHIKPTAESLREFRRHRDPQHKDCINSPVSSR